MASGRLDIKREQSELAAEAVMGAKKASLTFDRNREPTNDARPSAVSEREPTAELLGEGPSKPGVPCR